jgi:non-canonical (house-cleaning) NTP pyrophosphatase
METREFWQRLQTGIEVAVAGPTPERHLGVRDGFLRFFRARLDRPLSIAVVPQEEPEELKGLPISDQEIMDWVERRAGSIEARYQGDYHFFVASEGGVHTVEREGRPPLYFVRNWTLVLSPIGAAWGSSGAVQVPERLLSGLGHDQVPFAVPGTRKSGGMIASLTGGLETRRRAVETATLHALSTLFYGILGVGADRALRWR